MKPVGGPPDVEVRTRHAKMPAGPHDIPARFGIFKDALLPQDFFLFQLHEDTPSRSIRNDRSVRKAQTYLQRGCAGVTLVDEHGATSEQVAVALQCQVDDGI